ncbi:MAG: hypothetical protein COB02_12980 [Candidatus Cloacimonadota bacterium]|nr:MAG: hypothetical protein COB02_12980 [Candidatus Cloacimonadota bacterium]
MNNLQSLLEKALNYHQNNQLMSAKPLYDKVLQINPYQTDALYLSGILLHQLGQSDQAILNLQKALHCSTDKINILYNLANIYFELNLIDQAISNYQEVLKLDPNHISSLKNLGSIYFSNNPQKSVEYFQKAFNLEPNNIQNLCLALNLIDQKKHAFELLRLNYNSFKNDISYHNTITTIIRGLNYLHLNQNQQKFIENLYETNLVCHDALNSLLSEYFFKSSKLIVANIHYDSNFDLSHISSIFLKFLRFSCVSSKNEEWALSSIRSFILLNIRNFKKANSQILNDLLEAIAIQEFKLEYSTFISNNEKEKLNKIKVKNCINTLLKACYHQINNDDVKILNENNYYLLSEVYSIENTIAQIQIKSNTLNNKVSIQVASQYEENPYPKWAFVQRFQPKPLKQFLIERLSNKEGISQLPNEISVLIAGCGTGKVLTELLTQIHYKNAIGIDLSIKSLQYTQHKINHYQLHDVSLKKLDLLDSQKLNEKFDFIDCCGVLHHLEKPQLGLKSITNILNNGGFMSLAFYSKIARRNINLMRERLKGIEANYENIVECRHQILNYFSESDPVFQISLSTDFYSISGCRDLLFHVCEHQYNLLELHTMLQNNNLDFCGFQFSDNQKILQYIKRFPQDKNALDLKLWHQFEQENPDFFLAMYQFYVRKIK